MAKIRILVEIEKHSTTCTGTALTCTGTGSVLEAIPHLFRTYTGTGSVLEGCTAPVPIQVAEIAHKWWNSPFFMHFFSHNSLLHQN